MSYAIKMGVYDDEKHEVVLGPFFDEIKDCCKGFKTKRGMYKGIYGYNGQKIIEGKFEEILPYDWAIITVDLFNKWQIHDWCGNPILKKTFDKIICKDQGFIAIDRRNHRQYAYDYDGNPLTDRYGKLINFYKKFIVLEDKIGDCYIYVYGKAEPIINGKFTNAFQVDGIIAVKNENGYGAYDETGRMISEHKWDMIEEAYNRCMIVRNFEAYYGVYDFDMKCILPDKYHYIHLFDTGIGAYVGQEGYYPFDYQGRRLMSDPAQDICIEANVIYRQVDEEWRAFSFEGEPLSEVYLSKDSCKRHLRKA